MLPPVDMQTVKSFAANLLAGSRKL